MAETTTPSETKPAAPAAPKVEVPKGNPAFRAMGESRQYFSWMLTDYA